MSKIEDYLRKIENETTVKNQQSKPETHDSISPIPVAIPRPSVPIPQKQKVCIIGDSISFNLDHKVVSNAMNSNVRSIKAYSS